MPRSVSLFAGGNSYRQTRSLSNRIVKSSKINVCIIIMSTLWLWPDFFLHGWHRRSRRLFQRYRATRAIRFDGCQSRQWRRSTSVRRGAFDANASYAFIEHGFQFVAYSFRPAAPPMSVGGLNTYVARSLPSSVWRTAATLTDSRPASAARVAVSTRRTQPFRML